MGLESAFFSPTPYRTHSTTVLLSLVSACSVQEGNLGDMKRSGGKEYGNAVTSCQQWVMKMQFASSEFLQLRVKCTLCKN